MRSNNPAQAAVTFKTKIALVIFILFLSVLLLELGLRFGGFIYRNLQEYQNLRAIERKGIYRIMCVGESMTAGQYPRFLEPLLNQNTRGITFSVIDTGLIGVRTPALLQRLEFNLAKYQPDMVVTMMGINDERIMYYKDIPEADSWIFQHCRLYRLMRFIYLRALNKLLNKEGSYGMNTASPGKIVQDSEEETLKKFVLLDYKNDGACVELGRRYRARGEFSLAESAFNKAIELNPKNDQAYLGLGWCYRYQGKSSLAESAFKKAIELNPKNDQAYLGLGWCYRARGEFSLTESAFKKAIELNPKNDQAYIRLGWCYRAQGKSSLAESAFKKAIELRSGENVVAYGMRSVLYEEIGRPDMAREYVRKANSLRLEYCNAVTAYNYRKLKRILDKRGVRLVVVQYPMRSIEPLKKIFKDDAEGVIFVDNEKVFRDAVRKEGFNAYFIDMFAGDFGHCTDKGNRLMAENIAKIILQEVFHK